jgi:hypothetical protein
MNIYSVQGALAEPLLGAIPMEEMPARLLYLKFLY